MKFELDGKVYPIVIERKLGQKNTYIRVNDKLEVYVTTGKLTSNNYILKLIKDNYSRVVDMINIRIKKRENNDGFFYLGKKYNINYVEGNKIYFDGDNVFIGKNCSIDNFYKNESKKIFLERLNYHYERYSRKIPYPKLRIRKMKTRWGVCNVKTHIVTLNLELMKRDTKYLDYVIIHELTHLVHGDHSSAFWSVVEENMPDYRKYKNDMKEFL